MNGRVCAVPGCGTFLSRYNADPTCYIHTQTPGRIEHDPTDDGGWRAMLEGVEPWTAPAGLFPPTWGDRAACASAGQLLEDFFAEETSDGEPTNQVLAAKSLCVPCPVRPECLTWAMNHEATAEFRSGVYGGLSPVERTGIAARTDALRYGLAILDEQVTMGLVMRHLPAFPMTRREDAGSRSSAERA